MYKDVTYIINKGERFYRNSLCVLEVAINQN